MGSMKLKYCRHNKQEKFTKKNKKNKILLSIHMTFPVNAGSLKHIHPCRVTELKHGQNRFPLQDIFLFLTT